MRLGEKIKYLRDEKGLTQKQLADMLEINRVTLTNYELGCRTPDIYTLKKIANFLEVTIDYLVSETL